MRGKRNVAPGRRGTHTQQLQHGLKETRTKGAIKPHSPSSSTNKEAPWALPTEIPCEAGSPQFHRFDIKIIQQGKKKSNNSVDTAWWAQCPIGARGSREAKSKVMQTYKKWQVTGQFSSLTNNRQRIKPYTLTVRLKQRSSGCQKTPRASQVTCGAGTGGWRQGAPTGEQENKA